MLVALVIQLFGFLRLPEAFSAQALARMSQQRLMDASIIRRLTVKATYAEIVALYRLTMNAPPHNLPPRYNVCPTDTAERELVTMRWGLVPWWWGKPLKELRMATFNARTETVETKPVIRDAFKGKRCLVPMSGYFEWQNTPSGK